MPQPKTDLSPSEFEALVEPALGLTVSDPWKGYGAAIFFELGELTPRKPLPAGRRRKSRGKGEAAFFIEGDWRVVSGDAVLFGVADSYPKIEESLETLRGTRLQALAITEGIPELVATFSNGMHLHSVALCDRDPFWCVRLPDGMWIGVEDGAVWATKNVEETAYGLTPEAQAVADRAKLTAERWGTPREEPSQGECHTCRHYVRLDADCSFLAYGVCALPGGPFDGRVVNELSGCPSYESEPD